MHNTTHAVMFHHFHDNRHASGQGSLSSSDFINMIEWLKKHYSIINANQYKEKFENQTLKEKDICLSFDDALKCQYDIAVPIMEKLGIEAFFFTHSSAFGKSPDPLEIFRHFRTTCFDSIDEFYEEFFEYLRNKDAKEFSIQHKKYKMLGYLSEYSIYTENDRWFRYLRDFYLDISDYNQTMRDLMLDKDFDIDVAKQNLWMSEQDLINLDNQGHLIGLHSYSHPTKISKLSKADQESEYKRNYKHLSSLLNKPIKVMSHPCGDYNITTLNILTKMNVQLGFRDNMLIKEIQSPLEIPREDHSIILKEMKK